MSSVDLRYARALSAVICDQKLESNSIKVQLENFLETFQASPDLREVLEDPSIPENQKLNVLDELARLLGIGAIARNFIAVVMRNRRLHQLSDMMADYATLADEESSVAEAKIVSAYPMDQSNRDLLEKRISTMTGSQRVHATYIEDPGLIGGVVVTVGSTVYDGSIRTQLEELKTRLIVAGA